MRSRGQNPRQGRTFAVPPPTKGWLQSVNVLQAPLDGAEVLDNFRPTLQGARLRAGCSLHATIDDDAKTFIPYQSGSTSALFAATDSALFDVTTEGAPTQAIAGLSSADWSHVQISTAGGEFVLGVNGQDAPMFYDGTNWNPISSEGIFDIRYDAQAGAFEVGATVNGVTSGATALIISIVVTGATEGILKVTSITGTFQDNETLTAAGGGLATSNNPAGVGEASTITISGVDGADLSQVWVHKERIWAVEAGTQNAWYLPVQSFGGAATKFPLGSVFRRGGNLLFGTTWSSDSGEVLQDYCVFVTDQGEVAVYEGWSPTSAESWSLVGVFALGRPLDKHAHFSIGGELYLLTYEGIIPLSSAVENNIGVALTRSLALPIDPTWKQATSEITAAKPVRATVWRSKGYIYFTTPLEHEGKPVSLILEANTGAWARYVGWDACAAVVFSDRLYFADRSSQIMEGETGGTDNGTQYTATWAPKFTTMGAAGIKHINYVRLFSQATLEFEFGVKIMRDYRIETVPAPVPVNIDPSAGIWGTSSWGQAVWGRTGRAIAVTGWKAAYGIGSSISPGFAITSNQDTHPDIEINGAQVNYEVGHAL